MNYRLIIRIALAMQLARWRQTLVAAIGVLFSITMFIGLLGFMNGLNDLLDGLIVNRTPHVRIFNDIKVNDQPVNVTGEYSGSHNFISSVKAISGREQIYNAHPIMDVIKKDPRVLGVSPKINSQVFFHSGTTTFAGVVSGIDAAVENQLFHFNEYIVGGNSADLGTVSNSIVLGRELAKKIMANVGDVIRITTPAGDRFSLRVVGFFQSGIRDFDKVQSYTSIATAQKLLGKGNNYITDIQVKLKDINQAPRVAREYRKVFQADTEDIQTANAQFETGSFIRSLISFAVGVTLLIVAGFGIYNILNMMIYEKMDSIAILKATGFSGRDVNMIFTLIALSIGVSGGLAGLGFGYLLSLAIDQVPFRTPSLPTVTTYPVNYSMIYYIIGLSFSLVTTYFAGFFPARKASAVDPVTIIRGK